MYYRLEVKFTPGIPVDAAEAHLLQNAKQIDAHAFSMSAGHVVNFFGSKDAIDAIKILLRKNRHLTGTAQESTVDPVGSPFSF